MAEYYGQSYTNEQQQYQQGSAPYGAPGGMPTAPHTPEKRGGRKKGGAAAKIARRIGAIALSAALFGGVAAGAFQGVNYLTGYTARAAGQEAEVSHTQLVRTGTSVADVSAQGGLNVTAIANAVMPSIVSITNKSVQEVQNYFSMFGFGAQTQLQETESRGSGIVIGQNEKELLIVTNYHVIQSASTISASFIDNQVYEAVVKGTDPDNDLAVIAVPLESISQDTMSQIAVASIGDSEALQVGEQVVAIGNALGYGQSVTTGIVSATNRTIGAAAAEDGEEAASYIQTDAAINPGNSGGALVNMKGEVIGINSAKLASTEIEGMGYAIPITRVADIIETLMNETTRTKVTQEQRSAIGISAIAVDETVHQMYGIPEGVYVAAVTDGGAAQKAGIAQGNVITAFDGKKVSDVSQLEELLQYYAAGETVEVTLQIPGNGSYSEKTVSLTLENAQAEEEQKASADRTENARRIPARG